MQNNGPEHNERRRINARRSERDKGNGRMTETECIPSQLYFVIKYWKIFTVNVGDKITMPEPNTVMLKGKDKASF